MGKQGIASLGCLIAYYGISIPFGAVFTFVLNQGVKGFWYGMLLGLTFISCFYQYVISFKYDWDKIAIKAEERLELNDK